MSNKKRKKTVSTILIILSILLLSACTKPTDQTQEAKKENAIMNPLLPLSTFIPDVEAREWQDGRLYFYGSYDLRSNMDYCSDKYHVYSTTDLVNFQDHGEVFNVENTHLKNVSNQMLYAPDCVYKDGKYYLYYCLSDNSLGVSVSDSPYGPFSKGVPVIGADGDGIDPAVLIDGDDAYIFWGQYHLRGAKLKSNMSEIEPSTINENIITESAHGFHEGASIRKINGIYYLSYTDISRGNATSIAYAMSDNPLTGYQKKGIIIDNTGCDPQSWNNHGSIASFKGKWYIFYHRSTHNSKFSRRVCAEPLSFKQDGTINEVEMTTQGIGTPLNPKDCIEAGRACLVGGGAYIGSEVSGGEYQEYVYMPNNSTATYKYFNFDSPVEEFEIEFLKSSSDCYIDIFAENDKSTLLGIVIVSKNTTQARALVNSVIGVNSVFLRLRSENETHLRVRSFRFL